MIDLPKDAEGREIPLDTKVLYDECGNEYEVDRYCCSVRQSIPERVWDAVMLDSLTYYTSRLYLRPPDSWEKLEDDLSEISKGSVCHYFHKGGSNTCEWCPADGTSSCWPTMAREIKSRIRKLRGED